MEEGLFARNFAKSSASSNFRPSPRMSYASFSAKFTFHSFSDSGSLLGREQHGKFSINWRGKRT